MCKLTSRGQLYKCTVPLTNSRLPLKVVMLSTLYGLHCRLGRTVHQDSSSAVYMLPWERGEWQNSVHREAVISQWYIGIKWHEHLTKSEWVFDHDLILYLLQPTHYSQCPRLTMGIFSCLKKSALYVWVGVLPCLDFALSETCCLVLSDPCLSFFESTVALRFTYKCEVWSLVETILQPQLKNQLIHPSNTNKARRKLIFLQFLPPPTSTSTRLLPKPGLQCLNPAPTLPNLQHPTHPETLSFPSIHPTRHTLLPLSHHQHKARRWLQSCMNNQLTGSLVMEREADDLVLDMVELANWVFLLGSWWGWFRTWTKGI
jgi:hypothetical protein